MKRIAESVSQWGTDPITTRCRVAGHKSWKNDQGLGGVHGFAIGFDAFGDVVGTAAADDMAIVAEELAAEELAGDHGFADGSNDCPVPGAAAFAATEDCKRLLDAWDDAGTTDDDGAAGVDDAAAGFSDEPVLAAAAAAAGTDDADEPDA